MSKLLLILLLCPALAKAQNVTFEFTGGASVTYAISDVRSTKGIGEQMFVYLFDGTVDAYDLVSIEGMDFSGIVTGSGPLLDGRDAPLHVFPNPTSDRLTIAFDLLVPAMITLQIFDVSGALVRTLHSGRLGGGAHSFPWDRRNDKGAMQPPGAYHVRLDRGNSVASTPLVVQH